MPMPRQTSPKEQVIQCPQSSDRLDNFLEYPTSNTTAGYAAISSVPSCVLKPWEESGFRSEKMLKSGDFLPLECLIRPVPPNFTSSGFCAENVESNSDIISWSTFGI